MLVMLIAFGGAGLLSSGWRRDSDGVVGRYKIGASCRRVNRGKMNWNIGLWINIFQYFADSSLGHGDRSTKIHSHEPSSHSTWWSKLNTFMKSWLLSKSKLMDYRKLWTNSPLQDSYLESWRRSLESGPCCHKYLNSSTLLHLLWRWNTKMLILL